MKIYHVLLIALLLLNSAALAAEEPITLSETDRQAVVKAAGLREDGSEYYTLDCDQRNSAELIAEDLNKDGQPEVFVRTQGMCLGGGAGVAISLFIKNPSTGKWKANLGFPGDYKILESGYLGFADLEITGPGTCFPVWQWNGVEYTLHRPCAVN